MSASEIDKLSLLDDLVGILPDQEITLDEIRQERLKRQCPSDSWPQAVSNQIR